MLDANDDGFEVVYDSSDGKYYRFELYDDGWSTTVETSEVSENSVKGAVQLLWEEFGGTVNDQGYKTLNPRVGLIYGDSITLTRCNQILKELMEKGFASDNVVFGIGSYTFQYQTRDTLGFAMKATYDAAYAYLPFVGGEYVGIKEYGASPLIAAARCYVVSRMGNLVEVPDELFVDSDDAE